MRSLEDELMKAEMRQAFLDDAQYIVNLERELLIARIEEKSTEEVERRLREEVARCYATYKTDLEGTPEAKYLERIARRYDSKPIDIETFITTYELSTRTANILLNLEMFGSKKAEIAKIKTPKELLEYDATQLLRITGFGRRSLLELDAAFQEEGWEIKGIRKYREMERKRQDEYR